MKSKRKLIVILVFLLMATAFGGGVAYGKFLVFRDGDYAVAELERRGLIAAAADAAPAGEEAGENEGLGDGDTVNINTADVFVLQLLPGIGPKKAAAIIAYREEHGPFTASRDLLAVSGIGEATLAAIEPFVTVD